MVWTPTHYESSPCTRCACKLMCLQLWGPGQGRKGAEGVSGGVGWWWCPVMSVLLTITVTTTCWEWRNEGDIIFFTTKQKGNQSMLLFFFIHSEQIPRWLRSQSWLPPTSMPRLNVRSPSEPVELKWEKIEHVKGQTPIHSCPARKLDVCLGSHSEQPLAHL